MIPANVWWTEKRREEYRAAKSRGWMPSKLHRIPQPAGAEPGGELKSPYEGFRFHSQWPDGFVVMESHHEGDAEARRCLDHCGWYTDSFWDGLLYACAVQVRIPRSRGKWADVVDEHHGTPTRVRWMEATAHTDWDQILIGRRSSDLHDTMKECIRSADRVAKIAAEQAREEDAKDQAEQQTFEAQEAIQQARAQIKEALADRKRASAPESLCRVLSSWTAERLAEIRKHRARIALLERDPWQAVSW